MIREQFLNSSIFRPSYFFASNCSCKVMVLPLWRGTKTTRRQPDLPCFSILSKADDLPEITKRRSAHYHPSIWDTKLIESLSTPYNYKVHATQLEKLKKDAKRLLKASTDHHTTLKLIDSMERFGVDYHFEEEIKDILDGLVFHLDFPNDLYSTALSFRLLRKHGYPISSDVFDKFKHEDGRFMDCLSHDLGSILSLHEASYLAMHKDNLEEAKKFSIKHMEESPVGDVETSTLAKQVQESLEIPLHWKSPRVETRNFINIYGRNDERSPILLELAILDYNVVQSVYQGELKELARWWRGLRFKEKLSFSRDRLMENYLWAMGISFKPQFSKCRIGLTKFVCILTAIDDMYDIFGSLDELERFTDAVDRWDIKAMEELPEYMKICYLAMFNFGNEIAYDVLRDHDTSVISCIKGEWAKLCRSYLVEARWFYRGYQPTVKEYLANAWTSVGGPAAMVHAYMLQSCNITKDVQNDFKHGSSLIYWSSLITRLCDDLGTFKAEIKRGDVAKSMHCYINEEGLSEEAAQERVKGLIDFSWKKLNEESGRNSLPRSMIDISMNMARAAHCIFQHGDGIGTSNGVTRDQLISLIIEPIQIEHGFN